MATPAEKMEINSLFVEINAKIDAADKAAKSAMTNIEKNEQKTLNLSSFQVS